MRNNCNWWLKLMWADLCPVRLDKVSSVIAVDQSRAGLFYSLLTLIWDIFLFYNFR